MRYTTIIDIRELPHVWKSESSTRLYVYMVLSCGYEDYNRDFLKKSIRSLAADAGLTLSATRHALEVLQKSRLIRKVKDGWKVVKWFETPTITPRDPNKRQTSQQRSETDAIRERERQNAERERQTAENKAKAVTRKEWEEMKKKGIKYD